MITLTLLRNKPQGKAVTGTLSFPLLDKNYEPQTITCPTLENADFLIPAGTYHAELTWSPKFKKFLPEIKDVFMPDGTPRTGIRIHMGSKPEHSTGCILLDLAGMSNTVVLFNQIENFYEDEQVQITITDGEA